MAFSQNITPAALGRLLAPKVANIPLNHIPNILPQDIIEENGEKLCLEHILHDVDLLFLFSNRHVIDGDYCTARKEGQRFNIARCIWYYRLDSTHDFSTFVNNTRYNLLGFLIFIGQPAHAPVDQPKLQFCRLFVNAWLEGLRSPHVFHDRERFSQLWRTSPYDLLTLTGTQKKWAEKRWNQLKWEWQYAAGLAAQGPMAGESQEQFRLRTGPLEAIRLMYTERISADSHALRGFMTGTTNHRLVGQEFDGLKSDDPDPRNNPLLQAAMIPNQTFPPPPSGYRDRPWILFSHDEYSEMVNRGTVQDLANAFQSLGV